MSGEARPSQYEIRQVFCMLKSAFDRIDFRKFAHVKYVLVIPIYMMIFVLEERYITAHYFVSYLPLDRLIPFWEGFVIPYVLWYPLMLGAGFYLFFKDAEGFKRYMLFIGCSFLLIVLFYAVFPNGQNLRPRVFTRDNILTDAVRSIYLRDTNTNVLPSLHVVGTLGAMFALLKCERLRVLWIKLFIVALSISICLSTVFIKQHSILDVFTGVPLAFAFYYVFYSYLPNRSRAVGIRDGKITV